MRLNERLSETEQVLEKALQDKQRELTSQPPEVTPTVTTAPPTVIIAVPSTIPTSTAEIITGTSATATAPGSSTTMTIEQLIKTMEELKLQVSELKQVKEKLAKVEQSYDKSKMNVAEKTREVKALEKKVRALEKDLSLHKPLAKIRGILWNNIIQSLSDVWRSIQTIYEYIDLIRVAQVEIQKTRALLGQMPEQANRLIHFLNTKTSEELEALDIRDRTDTILDIKRVLTIRTLMQNLDRRCQDMQIEIDSFADKFIVLQQKGLPSPLGDNNRLMNHKDYVHKLNTYAINQANASSSTSGETALPSSQSLYDCPENIFYIEHEVKHLFTIPPNFFRYTETNETLRKLQRHKISGPEWW